MLLGIGNIVTYGLSLYMKPSNYAYYFHYTGNGKFFQPFKALVGCDNPITLGLTAPSLILGGAYMQKSIGSLRTAKMFLVSLAASYTFMSAFANRDHYRHTRM